VVEIKPKRRRETGRRKENQRQRGKWRKKAKNMTEQERKCNRKKGNHC
jgi:hypothetical protein